MLIEGEAGIGKSRLVDELGRVAYNADGEDLNFLFGSYPPERSGERRPAAFSVGLPRALRRGRQRGRPSHRHRYWLRPSMRMLDAATPPPKECVRAADEGLSSAPCFVHATRNARRRAARPSC